MSETTYIESGWLENEQNEVNLAQERRLDMVLCDLEHANAQGDFNLTQENVIVMLIKSLL